MASYGPWPRAILGLLLAPLAGALVLFLLFLVEQAAMMGGPAPAEASMPGRPVGVALLGLILGAPVALLGGLPIYLLFRRMNWLHLWQSLLVGAVLGALVLPALALAAGRPKYVFEVDWITLLAAFCGAVGGATFWWLVFRPLARHAAPTVDSAS